MIVEYDCEWCGTQFASHSDHLKHHATEAAYV